MDLLSLMALRGHGGCCLPSTLFQQKPLQPQVCYSLSILSSFVGVCVRACVCVCVVGIRLWLGRGDLQEWETHVTVTLWVFVWRTACLVRMRGHSQLLDCSTMMWPEPILPKQPRPHKQDASMCNCTSVEDKSQSTTSLFDMTCMTPIRNLSSLLTLFLHFNICRLSIDTKRLSRKAFTAASFTNLSCLTNQWNALWLATPLRYYITMLWIREKFARKCNANDFYFGTIHIIWQ